MHWLREGHQRQGEEQSEQVVIEEQDAAHSLGVKSEAEGRRRRRRREGHNKGGRNTLEERGPHWWTHTPLSSSTDH